MPSLRLSRFLCLTCVLWPLAIRGGQQAPTADRLLNAASPAYGAQISVEASATAFKDRKASVASLVDGNPGTRYVVTGAPYTVRIALPFPVNVSRLGLSQSAQSSETAPKDIEVSFDDAPPVKHTLTSLRPAKNKPAWQDLPVGRPIQNVRITVNSHYSGNVNWGGLGEIALFTSDPLDAQLSAPDYDPTAAAFVHDPATAALSPAAPKVILPPPAAAGEFPRLLFTPAELARFRSELAASERGQATLKAFLDLAQSHLGRAPQFPSPADTAANKADKQHNALAHRAQTLAFAFALTGDNTYAQPARDILLGYAARYEGYPRHSARNKNDNSKVMFQRLSEAMWLIPLLQSYDYLRASDVLTASDIHTIETGLLRPAILEIRRKDPAAEVADRTRKDSAWRTATPAPSRQGKFPNWINFYSTATLMTGSLLDNRDLMDLAAADFRTAIATGIGDDGMWGEGAIGYQLFAMGVMVPGFEAAARQGIDLWNVLDGRFKRLFDTPLRYAYPDGTLPGINDSSRGRLGTWQSMIYDYGYLRYGDPAYAFAINASPRQLHTSEGVYAPTRFYELLPESPALPGGSTLFGSLGYAVLRDAKKYSLLKYGPHGGVHGHYDRLNLVLFGEGAGGARDELAGEPTFYPYTNPLHDEWTVHTVAHNTVTVDEHTQAAGEGRLLVYEDTPALKVMRAQSASSYPGVLLDRTVIVTPEAIIDLFHGASNRPHTWDRTVRFTGPRDGFPTTPAAASAPALGASDGYQHLNVVTRQPVSGNWAGVWNTKAGALTATTPALPAQELIQALSPEGDQIHLFRQTGTTADFPFIYALQAWNNPVKTTAWSTDAGAGVIETTWSDGSAVTVIAAQRPGAWQAAGWSSDARVLYVKQKAGAAEVFVGGGSFATRGDLTLRLPATGNHLARQIDGKFQIVSSWTAAAPADKPMSPPLTARKAAADPKAMDVFISPGIEQPVRQVEPASPSMPSPDLKRLREHLRHLIVSGLPHSPDFVAVVENPSPQGTWTDIDYADKSGGWKPRRHLQRTQTLALRAATEGDDESAAAALSSLVWWVEHDPLSPNWWHNQIGSPRLLAHTLILLGDRVPPRLLADCRPIFERAGDFYWMDAGKRRQPIHWTGANRLWISANRLLAGALYDDETLIGTALADALKEIRVASSSEEGIQADGSFHQHGPLLYNGGYGSSFLGECLFFLEATQGTRWEPESRYQQLLADFLLDGTRWMLRGADFNHGSRDREITRPRQTTTGLARLAAFLAQAAGPRQAELQDLADALQAGSAPGHLTGNRMFYRSDFMVQQEAASCLSVRMHSARTARAESLMGEGLRSHHLADGLTYLLKTGEEYRDIFPVWDWQKLPGITCRQTPKPEPSDTVARRSPSTSVGGVSDGRYGVCTQHLQTDHLNARKSWFFEPDGLVCLGAGIRSSDAGPVVTTLDQSLRQGPVECDAGGAPLNDGPHLLRNARWLRHGPWGFVFPQPTDLTVELGPRTGAWNLIGNGPADPVTRDVFLAYSNHGDTPKDAAYAYLVVADADRARLTLLAQKPGFQIAANTEVAQAVWRPESGLLQAVFHEPGEITWGNGGTLRVNRVCCVQLRREPTGDWRLDVADVQQQGGHVDVEFREAPDAPAKKTTIPFPTGDHAGESVRGAWAGYSKIVNP